MFYFSKSYHLYIWIIYFKICIRNVDRDFFLKRKISQYNVLNMVVFFHCHLVSGKISLSAVPQITIYFRKHLGLQLNTFDTPISYHYKIEMSRKNTLLYRLLHTNGVYLDDGFGGRTFSSLVWMQCSPTSSFWSYGPYKHVICCHGNSNLCSALRQRYVTLSITTC